MPDSEEMEVYRQLPTSQDKYTYFLLAAAASAVALVVNRTTGVSISMWQIPLGLAVSCWLLSFFFGCRHVAYVNSNLYANAELFRVKRGAHPVAGTHPQQIAAAIEGVRQAMEFNSNKANSYAHWQFRLLISGGILYVAWHVLEMARLPIATG